MKTEFKGTKHDWYIDGQHIVANSGDCQTNETICDINPTTEYNTVYERSPTEAKSNAHIIAASFDLLEALQNGVELMEYLINATPTGKVRNTMCDFNIIAQSAIKKALNLA